jgi:hypothetical protein
LSFEGNAFLVFVEAKLYSPMSQADPDNDRPHNQIARKLTIGLRAAEALEDEFKGFQKTRSGQRVLRLVRLCSAASLLNCTTL